jgi:hypothetical protein
MPSKDNKPYDEIDEYIPSFEKIPSYNDPSIDYNRLKNKPTSF